MIADIVDGTDDRFGNAASTDFIRSIFLVIAANQTGALIPAVVPVCGLSRAIFRKRSTSSTTGPLRVCFAKAKSSGDANSYADRKNVDWAAIKLMKRR